MATMRHMVWIDAPVGVVYAVLASAEGLGAWWAPHASVWEDGAEILSHSAGEAHGEVRMKVVERVPDTRVAWEIISTHPPQSPASAWTGTRITFDLSVQPSPGHWMGQDKAGAPFTRLDFSQAGWDEASPFYAFCNCAWGETLGMLREHCQARR
jgi:uncharacterized protein YndB with AHSA1/START domain